MLRWSGTVWSIALFRDQPLKWRRIKSTSPIFCFLLAEKNQKKYIEWADTGFTGPPPDDWLAAFPMLLNWVADRGALTLVELEKNALLKLNDYRTEFVRFKPGGWSIALG